MTVNRVRDDGYTVHNLRGPLAPAWGVWEVTEFRLGIENLVNAQFTPNFATRPTVGRNSKITPAKPF